MINADNNEDLSEVGVLPGREVIATNSSPIDDHPYYNMLKTDHNCHMTDSYDGAEVSACSDAEGHRFEKQAETRK